MKRIPKRMVPRLWTMFLFTLGLAFTGFGNFEELVFGPFMGWVGALIGLGMYALWQGRTRPVPNGFWILLGILWFALAVMPIRPYHGLVVTIPVALFWLHDAPASPSAMLTWGMVATLAQDFEVWENAGADQAFHVVVAMVLFIAAAQAERQRLAKAQYAPTGRMWMYARLGAVFLWALTMVAAREALRAVNFFTYLGFDLRGFAGKVTMLLLILASLAAAAMLFRTRPYQYRDPYAQPVDKRGRRVARQSEVVGAPERAPRQVAASTHDFDAGPSARPKAPRVKAARVAKQPTRVTSSKPKAPAKPLPTSRPKPTAKPLKPGEIDFD